MSATSTNLSNRIFFTIVWTDGTAYIGLLDGKQEKLVRFTKEELINLVEFLCDLGVEEFIEDS